MKINKLDVTEVADAAMGPKGADKPVVANFSKLGKTGAAKITKAGKGAKANGSIKNAPSIPQKKPMTDSPWSQPDKAPKPKKAK